MLLQTTRGRKGGKLEWTIQALKKIEAHVTYISKEQKKECKALINILKYYRIIETFYKHRV